MMLSQTLLKIVKCCIKTPWSQGKNLLVKLVYYCFDMILWTMNEYRIQYQKYFDYLNEFRKAIYLHQERSTSKIS